MTCAGLAPFALLSSSDRGGRGARTRQCQSRPVGHLRGKISKCTICGPDARTINRSFLWRCDVHCHLEDRSTPEPQVQGLLCDPMQCRVNCNGYRGTTAGQNERWAEEAQGLVSVQAVTHLSSSAA